MRIAVVAHETRHDHADKLADTVGAAFLSVDNGIAGVTGNHRRVWTELADRPATDWSVALEDDAVPVDGFNEQLEAALARSPSPVVGLYVGRYRPARWQRKVERATIRADEEDACWLMCTHLLHCVGYATRDPARMAAALTKWHNYPPEEAISRAWRGTLVAHCWPSLIDHNDHIPSLLAVRGRDRDLGRVAWRAGCRAAWSSRAVNL